MILTRSTRLFQPQGPVEISPDFGGAGVVYLPNVRSGITPIAGTVERSLTPKGVSAVYTAGAGTTIERLTGSAPNGVTEFTQIIYLTPQAGGAVNDRGLFGNWNATGATGLVQLIHRARDAATNGKFCYVFSYDPTNPAAAAGIRTADNSAADGVDALLIATVKNGSLNLYLNGVKHGSTAVSSAPMSSQADLQIGNYYDNNVGRRLSAQIHLGAFLPRGVSDVEAFALSENPWQLFRPVPRRIYFDMGSGGSTTPVSTDLTGEYAIRSAVQCDSSGAYVVLGVAQADASSAYTVLGAVSADAAANYTIRASAQADLAASFTALGSVQADAASSFTVRGSTQADAQAAYLLRGSVSSDIGGAYDILNANSVSSSLAASYVVRGAAQSDVSGSYDLRTSVGAASEHAFMVRGLVSSDLASSYEVQAAASPVYADLAGSYAVDGIAPDFTRSIYLAAVPAEKFSAAVASKTFTASVPSEKFSAAVPGGNQ